MKAAYDMFSTNIKTIFRRTWLAAIVYTIVASLAIVLSFYGAYLTPEPSYAFMTVGVIFAILSLAASVWFNNIIISLVGGASFKSNLPRVIRLTLLILGITIIVGIIAGVASMVPFIGTKPTAITQAQLVKSNIISFGIVFLYIIAMIPLLYSSMKYLIEHDKKLKIVIGKPYCTGWKHWGYLFMLCFLAGIIITIIYMIANMPMSIASIAAITNAAGVAMGDESGMPGYFMPLYILATLISTFIIIYVGSWFTMIVYYAYGHIEAKEKAKKEAKAVLTQAKTDAKQEPDFEEIK